MKQERKETLNSMTQYPFKIIRPGGNDTCLIFQNVTNAAKRKELNDLIMQTYPSVEQVGFVNPDRNQPSLTMAGGEFCGNATRSTAWNYLSGNQGTLELTVSGVAGKLKAGINQNGEAFAQMPIYSDCEKVREDEVKGNYIVEMEGITQYIDTTTPIEGLTPEGIKALGMSILKKKGLTNGPAAGVMFTRRDKNGVYIEPVVYVRDIDTLFYETACGSGTTAVGLVLAKNQGATIERVPVYQPSGMPINISVQYENGRFAYAEISGGITELASGMIEQTKNGNYILEQVNQKSQLTRLFQSNQLPQLYNLIFNAPPYYENFSPAEVAEIFTEYVNSGLLFVMRDRDKLIGFGAALPLATQKDLSQILQRSVDPGNTVYMADLGVDPNYRNQGLAKSLVEARINAYPKGTTVVMRTSEFNIASQNLYRSLGFRQIPDVFQEVKQTRTDGTKQTDRRIFLVKTI